MFLDYRRPKVRHRLIEWFNFSWLKGPPGNLNKVILQFQSVFVTVDLVAHFQIVNVNRVAEIHDETQILDLDQEQYRAQLTGLRNTGSS